MKYLADAAMAKACDLRTVNEAGIPSMVLMERAALGVAKVVKEELLKNGTAGAGKIISVCGTGNNGADGVACARILREEGYDASVCIVHKSGIVKDLDFIETDQGKASYGFTSESISQIKIAKACGVPFLKEFVPEGYDVIIDAIFGIGLSREPQGVFADVIEMINAQRSSKTKVKVISVDIPSGVSTGDIYLTGAAVRADVTVTFGNLKTGLAIGRGAELCGKTVLLSCGFSKSVTEEILGKYFYYEKNELKDILPKRKMISHKGSYGRICIVAGKRHMSGAGALCAGAALKSGAGMVKVISDIGNAGIILSGKPELMFDAYNDEQGNIDTKALKQAIDFADIIAIGPGLGTDERACEIFEYITANSECPIIVDADGINLLADKCSALIGKLYKRCVITPHIAEMSRIVGKSVEEIRSYPIKTACGFAEQTGIITVLKDYRTVVSNGERVYVNMAGNDGMATAGCGDVLCGIIASMCAQGAELFEGAVSGCFLHSAAADLYAKKHNRYSLNASDIIDSLADAGCLED